MGDEIRGRRIFVWSAMGTLLVPGAFALLFGIDPVKADLAGAGVVLTLVVWRKPRWFWGNIEIEALRELLGDRTVAGLYYVIAALLLYMASVAELPR